MPDHSECMKRKIELLMAEGYPQDQAVAISYKHCGETQKSAQSAIEKMDLSMDQIHVPSADQRPPDCKFAHDFLMDETKGSADYQAAIEHVQDANLKALLQDISSQEAEHMAKLATWIEAHKPETAEKSCKGHSCNKHLTVEICKVADNIIYGIVLKANKEDLQGDIMSPEDIAKAAQDYIADYRAINVGHSQDIQACPVESWVAKEAGKLGDRDYGHGDWLMGTRIDDPVVLQKVRDGLFKSYSIEGEGQRVPIAS